MTMHAVLKESILANDASKKRRGTSSPLFSRSWFWPWIMMLTNISSAESTTTVFESSDYLNALNAIAEKAMENFSKTNSMVSLIKLLSGEGVPNFSSLG